MAYSEPIQALIDLLQDRAIAYHPVLARALNSVSAAIWLGQLMYWDGKGTKLDDGWIEKTAAEFEAETALTRREQDTARNACIDCCREVDDVPNTGGVVSYKLQGLPAKSTYKINYAKLQEAILRASPSRGSWPDPTPQSSLALSAKLDSTKAPNKIGGKRTYNTEITSESTSLAQSATASEPEQKPEFQRSTSGIDIPAKLDPLTDIFDRATSSRDSDSAWYIKNWNLPTYLQELCIWFADEMGLVVTKLDKSKWAKGALVLYEMHPTREQIIEACKKAKGQKTSDGKSLTYVWPKSIEGLVKEIVSKAAAPKPKQVTLTEGIDSQGNFVYVMS